MCLWPPLHVSCPCWKRYVGNKTESKQSKLYWMPEIRITMVCVCGQQYSRAFSSTRNPIKQSTQNTFIWTVYDRYAFWWMCCTFELFSYGCGDTFSKTLDSTKPQRRWLLRWISPSGMLLSFWCPHAFEELLYFECKIRRKL